MVVQILMARGLYQISYLYDITILQNCKRKWVCHLSFHIVSVVNIIEVLADFPER